MKKTIIRMQEMVDTGIRNYCDRLPKRTQRGIVLAMLCIFALFSISLFGYSLYCIGKNKGQEMAVEHLRPLPHEIIQESKGIKP